MSDPQLSPDGKWVLIGESRANLEENRFDRSLARVEVATGAHAILTPGRHRVGLARWSPRGDQIAFLDADEKGKTQLLLMPSAGGEARKLTSTPLGVDRYAWSPSGSTIAYTTEDEPPTVTGEERHNKSFEVGDNGYLVESAPSPSHLWLLSLAGGETRRLTSGVESVEGSFTWSADGSHLAYVRFPSPHSGALFRASLVSLDVGSGTTRVLDGPASLDLPAESPDGKWLTWLRPTGAEPLFTPEGVFIAPSAGGPSRRLTSELDRSIGAAQWMPSSDAMLVGGPDGTHGALWLQPLDGPPRRLALGAVEPSGDFNVGRAGQVAFIGSESRRARELYIMESPAVPPRRLTTVNDSISARSFGRVETIAWKGHDGFDEDGVLVFPPDFDPSRKYPLVLYIHGGPMGASTEGFSLVPHLLAAQGWLVFSPNYRGSNNHGIAYQRAVVNDAGEGPGRDVMAGVAAVKARGFVDPDRVAVSGWSYGGYMTVWLTSHFGGWRAAVAGAAVTDWFDWYTLADMNVWSGFGLGGSPYLGKTEAAYRAQSPITFANRIKTPTLILSDVGDPRVTVTQSYKLYHALKDNGTVVKFVAYPIGGHFPGDPIHQRDVYRRWIDWIAQQFTTR